MKEPSVKNFEELKTLLKRLEKEKVVTHICSPWGRLPFKPGYSPYIIKNVQALLSMENEELKEEIKAFLNGLNEMLGDPPIGRLLSHKGTGMRFRVVKKTLNRKGLFLLLEDVENREKVRFTLKQVREGFDEVKPKKKGERDAGKPRRVVQVF